MKIISFKNKNILHTWLGQGRPRKKSTEVMLSNNVIYIGLCMGVCMFVCMSVCSMYKVDCREPACKL